jgi:membrane associated rhomboid family serine protease
MALPPSTLRPPLPLPADHRTQRVVGAIRGNLALLLGLAAAGWALEILDFVLFGSLDRFGIRPRSTAGIWGIVMSPFLHAGLGHLASNTLPFLALGGTVLLGGRRVFALVSILVVALGGAAVWMLGPGGTNHIGASLLIFGYLGFLLARGVVERSGFWIVGSLVVLVIYGGLLRGVLPGQTGVSWQGHLFGFLAGAFAARVLLARRDDEIQ